MVCVEQLPRRIQMILDGHELNLDTDPLNAKSVSAKDYDQAKVASWLYGDHQSFTIRGKAQTSQNVLFI